MSKGPDSQTVTTQPQVPPWMQPFLQQSAGASQDALTGLQSQLSQPNALVQPFDPLQLQSQDMQLDIAQGGGGFIPTAQDVLMNTATGGAAQQVGGQAINRLQNFGGRNPLAGFANQGFQLDSTADNALRQTASGDFLFGNPAFDEAVNASIRAAQPTIASTFSGAGSGGLKSGLAQIGMQQAASDAFARQFGNERNRQLGAAGQLGNFQLQGRQQQMGAADALAGRDLQSGSVQGNLATVERGRQLNAAQMLPQLGLLPSNLIGQVGGQRQAQGERQGQGAINQNQLLLQSAFGNINPNSLFGQTQTQPFYQNRAAGGLGGALTGAQLAGLIPGIGPLAGAIGGGLLGALG